MLISFFHYPLSHSFHSEPYLSNEKIVTPWHLGAWWLPCARLKKEYVLYLSQFPSDSSGLPADPCRISCASTIAEQVLQTVGLSPLLQESRCHVPCIIITKRGERERFWDWNQDHIYLYSCLCFPQIQPSKCCQKQRQHWSWSAASFPTLFVQFFKSVQTGKFSKE